MRSWRGACAAVVVPLLLVLSGCAGRTTPTGEEPESPRPSASAGPEAVSVRLVVSGGIAGTHDVYTVTRDDAAGAPGSRAARILALAADPAVRRFASEQVRRSAACCDLRVFEVAVRYADGTRTHIKAPETRTEPAALRRLVTLMSQP